jgi:hypothetical protein
MALMEAQAPARHLSLEELQAGLAGAKSPRDYGTLEMIVRRPATGERQVLDRADLSLDVGLVGDNWQARGSKSTPDGSANPEAQVTLTNSRVMQLIAQERSRWPLAGDQLYVDLDLSEENLPPGQRLAVGGAVLEVSAVPHTGCLKFTERFGEGAIHFVNSAEGRQNRRRGINAKVVRPGAIRLGDKLRKVASETADGRG